MKKLLVLIALCLPAFGYGQTKYWNETFNITTGKTDSVYSPSDPGDIAAYPSTVTFVFTYLSDTVTLDLGGSNNPLDTSVVRLAEQFAFEGIEHDSLPYNFVPANCQVITNGDTSVEKTFKFIDPWGFLRPEFSLTTQQDSVFTMKIYWTFSK